MIKLVAFDWNGTILADTYAVFKADNEVLKRLGEKPVNFSDFLKHFDVPVKNYYLALGMDPKKLEANLDFISHTFHDIYESKVNRIRSRANARTVLKWLKKHEIESIIISNHIKDRIEEQLARLKLKNYISQVLGNFSISSAMKARNKQERLLEYLKETKTEPKEILIVGDSIEEVEIAKEIGALSAAITHGNVSTKRLKRAKPDYLISDLGNVINIVHEINTA